MLPFCKTILATLSLLLGIPAAIALMGEEEGYQETAVFRKSLRRLGENETLSSSPETSSANGASSLTFYAIGDTPYSNTNLAQLPGMLETMSTDAASNGAEFLIHLGDIKKGPPACTEDVYEEVAGIFNESSIPWLFVLGDNEWVDCLEPDSTEGLGYWNKHLLRFEEKYWNPTFEVIHQDIRDENFAFFLDGVLVIGVNLVSTPRKVNGEVLQGPFNTGTAWEDRLDDNILFTQDMFDQYRDVLSAVVIFGHAANHYNSKYIDEIAALADTIDSKPLLFMQGNKHVWEKKESWKRPNMMRVTVDSDSKNTVAPVKVVVDPTKTELSEAFTFYPDLS